MPDHIPGDAGEETAFLIGRYQAGDQAALDRLMARFYGRVSRIVGVRLGVFLRERVELEDVVHQTLLRVLRGLERFQYQGDARLIEWLAKLAQNEIANLAAFHRAEKRDARRETVLEELRDSAESTFAWEPSSDSAGPSSKLARHELEELVDTCLTELAAEQREVILLRDYAGADWAHIAEVLGRPSAGAAQQLHRRARAELAEIVKRRV